jgi:hypothetical protein
MEDCYFSIREKFKELSERDKEEKKQAKWILEQSELIENSVAQFFAYNKPLALSKFVKNLACEFKIPSKEFQQVERALIIKAKEAVKDEDTQPPKQGESKTVIVENWIKDNYDLYFNEVSHRYIGRRKGEPELKEIKLENLYHDLDINHLKYGWSDLKILLRTDYIETMNPFLNYFENLSPWDGTDHINRLASYIKLSNIGNAPNERARFENQFKKMFVRSIACCLEADFNKHCFTLVHEQQNSGKSTFLRWLCPPELQDYYSENTGLSKDDRIALAENFIINIDELDAMMKHDINALKSLVSKDGFKERLPYAERTEFLKRRCNFVASTNRKEFLADETGSVRWICFHIDSINWNYKSDININDVWGQAYHIFRTTNYKYQLTVEEIQENEKANRQFFMRTVEMDLISKLYSPATEEEIKEVNKASINKWDTVQFLTATEIKEDITGKTVVKDHLSNINLGKALKFLGFEQRSERFSGDESHKGYWIKEKGEKKWGKNTTTSNF